MLVEIGAPVAAQNPDLVDRIEVEFHRRIRHGVVGRLRRDLLAEVADEVMLSEPHSGLRSIVLHRRAREAKPRLHRACLA